MVEQKHGLNLKGFSLLEMLIALAVGSIVIMGSVSMFVQMSKQQQVLTNRFDRADLESGLRSQLFSLNTCGCNMKSKRFADSVLGLKAGYTVDEMKTFSGDCLRSMPLAKAGSPLPGSRHNMIVDQIKMRDGFKVSDSTYVFTLDVAFESSEEANMRPVTVSNVYVKVKDIGAGQKEVIGCSTNNMPDVIPNQCYTLTCTPLSGLTRTITTTGGTSGNYLSTMAPSGMGYWSIEVRDDKVIQALNCFSDQAVAAGAQGSYSGQPLCMSQALSGRNCSAYGTCTYSRGVANPFAVCTYKPC